MKSHRIFAFWFINSVWTQRGIICCVGGREFYNWKEKKRKDLSDTMTDRYASHFVPLSVSWLDFFLLLLHVVKKICVSCCVRCLQNYQFLTGICIIKAGLCVNFWCLLVEHINIWMTMRLFVSFLQNSVIIYLAIIIYAYWDSK